MSEEIYIDGVNVAGCEYFDNAMCQAEKRADGNTITECFGFTCYYKQLKRLQAENEELKKFCVQLEKTKEEQHLQWQQRCTENHNEDSKLIEKYRKALEQIREYLKTQIKMRNKGYHFDYTNACENLLPIQRIVDEVLNDEIHN